MIFSKYTYQFKYLERYYIYNSLSNSFAELDEETYLIIKKSRDTNYLAITDDKLLTSLTNMKVIVENDKDEINKIKYLNILRRYEDRELALTINPTLSCNFGCYYCFEHDHPNRFMNESVENKIIEFIKSHIQAKILSVTWFGGEPLLAFDRIVSLTKKMQALGLKYKADMISNGYLLTENIISKLPSLHISVIQITIDGLSSIHDKRRYLKNGKPTLERILANIDLAQHLCPQVRINIRVNVDKGNKGDFVKLYAYFEKKHYPNVKVSLSFVKDITGCESCDSNFSCEQQGEFAKEMLLKHGLDFSMVFPMSERKECFVRNKNAIVIGPEGELYKCWNDVGDKNKVVGDIDGKITNEALLLRYLLAADPFEDPKCQDCFLLPVCGGGCPYSRIQNEYEGTNINTCLFMKDHLEEFLIAHAEYKERLNKNSAKQ